MNLFRVVQESINNAIKYSGGNEINVKLKKEENTLIISIEDNGIGFEKDKITFGNGLENMKKRIKEVGGELEINSILEKGTYIKIKYYNTTKSVL